jgi:hypothetical protein
MNEALLDFLEAQGVGVKGTDMFLHVPDEPDVLLALLPYQGENGKFELGSGLPIDERPRFQLLVRDVDETLCEAKIKLAHDTLHIRHGVIPGASYIFRVKALQPPFFLKRDEKNRALWVCNFRGWKVA